MTNRLVRLNWEMTAVFLIATAATQVAATTLDIFYAVFCSAVFILGFALFVLGFWNGAQRSRSELVNLPGLLAISSAHVPAAIRNTAWTALGAQVLIALAAAIARPFTPQVFGLLVPLFGLGLNTLLGSRIAEFFPRDSDR